MMALSPGTRFGPYEIAGEIGAGGMGVVYRATDTTLDRDVAIKVLPESMASDAERIARFDREAKTLASLNHPNIAQIYGLERSDDTTALVMELVEGPTLADRIEKGAIPADEALGIAMQIAEALEAAHGQSIVHRDLKPANVKLRPDGTVKVLDFGIAKALEPENLTSGPQSPMMTTPATMAGVILGTAAYMSPEQAKGKQVDQRADIWAFGVLLYEILTGQLAFGAEDVPTTLARVIANETDLDSLPAAISPAVRQTIQLCLQKDVRKRVADIRDVRLAIEGAFDTVSPQATEAAVVQSLWRRAFPSAVTAVVAVLATGLIAWTLWPASETSAINRFDFDLPEDRLFRQSNRPLIALSPDGRHFVYDSEDGIVLRPMGDLEARLIPGSSSDAISPFFSPDGRSVGYYDFSKGQLERIAIGGGAPVAISEMSNAQGLTWEPDGTILVGQLDGIYRVPATGGELELIISVVDDEGLIYGPELLPGGDSVLFSVITPGAITWDVGQVVAQSLSTGERTVLVEGGSDAHYLPTGHLVYAFEDGLFAVAFDPDSLTVSGGAVPLVQEVRRDPASQTGHANYSVSEDGTLIYVRGNLAVLERSLVWVDRTGRETAVSAPPRTYTNPSISPDGTKVALDVRDQDFDIWTWDLARETLTRLTFDPGQDEFPVWSPDGQRIAFSSTGRDGASGGDVSLFWRAADGTGSAEQLAGSDGQIFPTSFLPDGTGILVFGSDRGGGIDDIDFFAMDGEDRATPLLETAFSELYPAVSPDGRWLSYVSDESGSEEVYVRPFPDIEAGRWQVSRGGGTQPLWARDGEEIFYRTSEGVMGVSVQTEPSFVAGNPALVFEGDYLLTDGGPNYDVSLDGERFLMIKEVQDASATSQIIIVENWFEEVKRLVPTE